MLPFFMGCFMLLEFKVWNYKSIDGVVVDFQKGSLFGVSGVGKTNLISAFGYAIDWLRGVAPYKEPEDRSNIWDRVSGVESAPSGFEFFFQMEGKTYRYGFEVGISGVLSEWLWEYVSARPRKLFERSLDKRSNRGSSIYKQSVDFKGDKSHLQSMTSNTNLFLRIGAQFNHPLMGAVWNEVSNAFRCVPDSVDSLEGRTKLVSRELVTNSEFREWSFGVLRGVSKDLERIRVSGFSGLDIPSFQHKRGELEEWLPLWSESRSFQFIYAALLSVFRAVQYRSVLVMDGLDGLPDSALMCLMGAFLGCDVGSKFLFSCREGVSFSHDVVPISLISGV